tara:strand:- start:18130 stop:19041 length:912 start_codon:yes stop_codon:yes gene_type:complete
MIVVTGANGFIGRNTVQALSAQNKEILLVDFVKNGDLGVMDPSVFLLRLSEDRVFASRIETVIHLGANSDTTCYDPHKMMRMNFNYSVGLLNACLDNNIRLIYASSAAVYGKNRRTRFSERAPSSPQNIYATSKHLFDEYVKCFINTPGVPQIVGLRYFNVYGPHENHKGKMASVIYQFFKQIKAEGKIKIFKGSENYVRDFISVQDVVDVNLHFLQQKEISGIFNCGTGAPRSFYDIARILQTHYDFEIEEIEMPEGLEEKYQKYTCANTANLINVGGYNKGFSTLEEGIGTYVNFLESVCQ